MASLKACVDNVKARVRGEPRSMQLISVAECEEENAADEVLRKKYFHLHKSNLQHVMSQVDLDMPVGIVSVVGASRIGKSFLLSCVLRILEATDSEDAFEEGKVGGTPGREDGFSWKAGSDGYTQGMSVWSQPFIREVNDGKGGRTKMAVLLVDTQGSFDHKEDPKLEACLFGLSTTLSSCQIFNVSKQVQVNNLGGLAVYLDYGDVGKDNVSKEAKRAGDNLGGDVPEDDSRPFQRLEFLIRDWQCWDKDDDTTKAPCSELRDKFLEYVDGRLGKSTADNRKIKGCFRDRIGCFGLPYPGGDVVSSSFDGDINQIDEGFRRLLTYYVETVIFDKLKATNLPALPNSSKDDFLLHFSKWVKLFSDGLTNGELPEMSSWLSASHATQNLVRAREALDKFKEELDKETANFVDPVKLDDILKKHKGDALSCFKPRGDPHSKKKAKMEFALQLDKEAERITRANNHRAPSSFWSSFSCVAMGALASAASVEVLVNCYAVYVFGQFLFVPVATYGLIYVGPVLAIIKWCPESVKKASWTVASSVWVHVWSLISPRQTPAPLTATQSIVQAAKAIARRAEVLFFELDRATNHAFRRMPWVLLAALLASGVSIVYKST